MDRFKSLLGLTDGGKRVYNIKETEVTQQEFEYYTTLSQILFGPKGLTDTLGPTWEMVHDPRFEKIENLFVIEKPAKFGGDARQGIQVQLADGTFTGTMAGLEQYSEVLGEGRYFHDVLRSTALLEAAATWFPERSFRVNPNDPHSGLQLVGLYSEGIVAQAKELAVAAGANPTVMDDVEAGMALLQHNDPAAFNTLGILSPQEKKQVIKLAATYEQYNPRNVKNWDDAAIWELIRAHCPNYFSKKFTPNQMAKTLFAILRADLLSLIADYAEAANIQETFLLDDSGTLYEPEVHGEEAPRVAAEVDILEKALTYRAEIRTATVRVLEQLGVADQAVDLTDSERDQLLRVIYSAKWPDEKPQLAATVLGFFLGIKMTGKTVDEREKEQLELASKACQRHNAGLRSGAIDPINRHTEKVISTERSEEERIIDLTLQNPLLSHVFLRLTDIERRLEAANKAFLNVPAGGSVDPERLDLLNQWISAARNPGITVRIGSAVTDDELNQLAEIEKLVRAAALLEPVFGESDYNLTEEAATELLLKVEEFDPTETPQVAEYEGELPALTSGGPIN